MKKLVYIAFLGVIGMILSCSGYDSDLDIQPLPTVVKHDTVIRRDTTVVHDTTVVTPPADTTTVTPPTNPDQNDPKWDRAGKKSLKPVGQPTSNSHKWEGRNVYYSGSDSLVRTADMTVAYMLSPSTGLSMAQTNEDAYFTRISSTSANSTNTSYGEWYYDNEGNKLRKVTNTFVVYTTEFSKTLTTTRVEGYSVVNGKEEAFLSHTVIAQYVDLSVVAENEYTSNDSIYNDKTYEMTVSARFTPGSNSYNSKVYQVKARHTVRTFIKMKEKEKTEKTDWEYVKSTLVFDPDGSYEGSKGAFAICIALKNKVSKEWCLAITSSGKYATTYDFKLYKFSFTDYPSNWKVDSAVKNGKQWEPAHISGSNPWYYEGKNTKIGMTMQEANNCGIKNFTGSHTAENSAILNMWTSKYAEDGSLEVYSEKGVKVFSIK